MFALEKGPVAFQLLTEKNKGKVASCRDRKRALPSPLFATKKGRRCEIANRIKRLRGCQRLAPKKGRRRECS